MDRLIVSARLSQSWRNFDCARSKNRVGKTMAIRPTVLACVGVAAVVLTFVALRVRFWIQQGEKLASEPGHRTPHVTLVARLTRLFLSTIVKRWFVGPVRVRNKRFLKFRGRLIIVLNHQTERDAIVMPAILRLLPFRALMAATQIVGLRKPLCAWLGIIAVHHTKNPAASLRTSIDILQAEDDTSFVVFPQGALHRDNELKREDFFDGTIMIAKKVQEKSKAPVAILCGGIAYDRNPAHKTLCQKFWGPLADALVRSNEKARKLPDGTRPSRLRRRLLLMEGFLKREFFGDTVYGAAVVWREPLLVSALPDNRKAAMDLVFENIKAASDEAHQMIA
jgi:1-acyl-sn-glycerol-3-phosphate acyltransferase